MIKDMDRKYVNLRLETYENLKALGSLGDSYSDVIDNIIEFGKSKGMTQATLSKVKHDIRNRKPTKSP